MPSMRFSSARSAGVLVYLREGTAGVPAARLGDNARSQGRQLGGARAGLARCRARRTDPARSQCPFDPAHRQPQPPLCGDFGLRDRNRRHVSSSMPETASRRGNPDIDHGSSPHGDPERTRRSPQPGPALAGWREYVHLPELGIGPLHRQDRHRRALGGAPCREHHRISEQQSEAHPVSTFPPRQARGR